MTDENATVSGEGEEPTTPVEAGEELAPEGESTPAEGTAPESNEAAA